MNICVWRNLREKFLKLKIKINKKSVEDIFNLELMRGDYGKCLKEIMLCGERLVTLNDYLIVNNKGIFIFNINKYMGSLYGKNDMDIWKKLNNNISKDIRNPIIEVDEGVKEIKTFFGEKYSENIYGKVIFTRASYIEENNKCILIKDLKQYIDGLEKVLKDEEVIEIFDELKILNIKDEKIRKKRKKLNKNYEMNLIHEKKLVEVKNRIEILNEMKIKA